MTNPYQSPRGNPEQAAEPMGIHPDWKWIAAGVYALCFFCMLGVLGKTNPPNQSVTGLGHGVLRLPAMLGSTYFLLATPLLINALLPWAVVALPGTRVIGFSIKQSPTPVVRADRAEDTREFCDAGYGGHCCDHQCRSLSRRLS